LLYGFKLAINFVKTAHQRFLPRRDRKSVGCFYFFFTEYTVSRAGGFGRVFAAMNRLQDTRPLPQRHNALRKIEPTAFSFVAVMINARDNRFFPLVDFLFYFPDSGG
jgi:hypothetical protein